MITLIDFIKNVEDEVFEKVLLYTRHQKDHDLSPMIWVHQLKGKVCLDYPTRPAEYAHLPIYRLCNLNKDLKRIPDKKAIKKWIEEEVLMHPSTVRRRKNTSS